MSDAEKNKTPQANEQSKSEKKVYEKPKLKRFGSVRELTQAITGSSGMDGGVAPANRTMTCSSLAPFVEEHRHLVRDPAQLEFYRAITEAVKPGDVVVDLGTGSGLHAMLAAQAGARKVYAIDSEPVLELAKRAALASGFHQIEWIQGNSKTVDLPEKADLLITNIGFFQMVKCLPDAIRRFVRPGGRIIPERVRYFAAPVSLPDWYEDTIEAWRTPRFGLDLSSFRDASVQFPHFRNLSGQELLADAQQAFTVDFQVGMEAVYSAELSFDFTEATTIHGFAGWYSFELSPGISFSAAPPLAVSSEVWTQAIFPLESPLHLPQGGRVQFRLTMATRGRSDEPVWRWQTRSDAMTMPMNQTNFNNMFFSELR